STLTRTNNPGRTLLPKYAKIPRTCRVPVVGATLIEAKSSRTSWRYPSSVDKPKKTGMFRSERFGAEVRFMRSMTRSKSRSFDGEIHVDGVDLINLGEGRLLSHRADDVTGIDEV